jgi:prepilin-type N-terminal cleavage/methylation domain-containing protein
MFFVIRSSIEDFSLRSSQGFTLIEMLISMTILAIFGSAAALHFRATDASFHRMNARSFVIQDLKRAQAEAITWGCRGVLSVSNDGKSYSYGCDFLEYDTNDPPAADRVFFSRKMPLGITVSTSSPLIFNSRGQSVDLDSIMANNSVLLRETIEGSTITFATGTLLGTGVFSFVD